MLKYSAEVRMVNLVVISWIATSTIVKGYSTKTTNPERRFFEQSDTAMPTTLRVSMLGSKPNPRSLLLPARGPSIFARRTEVFFLRSNGSRATFYIRLVARHFSAGKTLFPKEVRAGEIRSRDGERAVCSAVAPEEDAGKKSR